MLMADFIYPEADSARSGRGDRREEDPLREAWANALSHELRTPITSIYGGSQLLLRHVVSAPDQVAIIGDIAAEAEHLHRLVEDLLVVVRLPAGARIQDPGPVLLQHIAVEAAREERRKSPGRRVVVHADQGVPAVRGDADYLRHLLRNLISNAINYSPADLVVRRPDRSSGRRSPGRRPGSRVGLSGRVRGRRRSASSIGARRTRLASRAPGSACSSRAPWSRRTAAASGSAVAPAAGLRSGSPFRSSRSPSARETRARPWERSRGQAPRGGA